MNNEKMRKGTFLGGQSAALSSLRVEKSYFCSKKGMFFTKTFYKMLQKYESINFKISNTLFRVSFAVLCSRIGTQLTSKPELFSPITEYCFCLFCTKGSGFNNTVFVLVFTTGII